MAPCHGSAFRPIHYLYVRSHVHQVHGEPASGEDRTLINGPHSCQVNTDLFDRDNDRLSETYELRL